MQWRLISWPPTPNYSNPKYHSNNSNLEAKRRWSSDEIVISTTIERGKVEK